MMDRVFVAESIEGDCVIGVYSTPERAIEACRKNAKRHERDMPEFEQSLNSDELRVWNAYREDGVGSDYYIEEFLIDDGE